MKKKWIAVIPSGKEQISSIQHIQSRGFKVVGIDASPEAYGRTYCDAFVQSDLNDTQGIAQALNNLNIDPVRFVPVVSDWSVVPCAELNYRFKIQPLNANVWAFVSKTHFRAFQDQNRLDPPKFWVIKPSDDIPSISQPVVVKPAYNSGSRGVEIIKNPSLESIRDAVSDAKGISKNGEVIIEEFIEGKEFSVDGYINNKKIESLLISERALVHQKSATTISSLLPSAFDYDPVKSKVEHLLNKLGVETSPFHIEVIQSSEKLTIIDFAVRGGGAGIFDQYYFKVTGFDLLKATLDTVMFGTHDEKEALSFMHGSISYVPITRTGMLEDISFNEKLLSENLFFNSFFKVGEHVEVTQDDDSRLGSVLSFSHSREEMIKRSNTFVDSIKHSFRGESH